MANQAPMGRKRNRILRSLMIVAITPSLIATNLLGTVPDNELSTELRREMSVALPEEFVLELNAFLDNYGMPTLPLQEPPEIEDMAGTWLYEYYFEGYEDYAFEDVIVIAKQGDGYVVTSITNNFGPTMLIDQVWDGNYLEFYYEIPASTVPYGETYLLYVKPLRFEDGDLIIQEEQGLEAAWTRLN